MRLRELMAAIVACAISNAVAGDVVRLKYRPGLPPTGVSVETAEVVVEREGKSRYTVAEVDRYFTAIKNILAEVEDKASCTLFGVDMPVIEVYITLEGRSLKLECNPLPLNSTISPEETHPESSRQRAFQRIVKLTVDRAIARMGR